jgi:quercetin dioxygenase-like cupin family protein
MMSKARVKLVFALALTSSSVVLSAASDGDEPPGFVQVLPSEIKWLPSPVVPGAQRAVLLGNPEQAGPFVMRVKVPPGARIMPHTHPEARTYTVLAGEWKLGFGDKYDPGKLRSFPVGAVYRLPANVPHFQATGQVETIVQIDGLGPSGHDYLNPLDDPRKR